MSLKDKKKAPPNIREIVEDYHRIYPLLCKRELRGQLRKDKLELFKTDAGLQAITRALRREFKNAPSPNMSINSAEAVVVERGEELHDGKWVPYEVTISGNQSSSVFGFPRRKVTREVVKVKY